MRKIVTKIAGVGALALLAGCAMEPRGPSISVFPAPYKPFDVFEQDQYDCEDYAHSQVAGDAQAANNRAVGSAAIGTALGLALGAATGSGRGAAVGAAGGAVVGSSIGASQSDRANFSLQRRYDIAYAQCMYAKGNQVPGFRGRRPAPPPPP
ncbi:MAG TPA: YMGG-like glycine zipper-containing protein, partial [Micropepsaceae bacterium]|nr:YMGG-like glycine zipper-containing protein [Micropepsaceae bacterium]